MKPKGKKKKFEKKCNQKAKQNWPLAENVFKIETKIGPLDIIMMDTNCMQFQNNYVKAGMKTMIF